MNTETIQEIADDNIQLEVITPSATLIDIDKLIQERIGTEDRLYPPCLYTIEHTGRICYNSYKPDRPQTDIEEFISKAAKQGHRSIFEMSQLQCITMIDSKNINNIYEFLLKNKYIKTFQPIQLNENVYSLRFMGSLRAFIEILESIMIDNTGNDLYRFFGFLYKKLYDMFPFVLLNWETAKSIDRYFSNIYFLIRDIINNNEIEILDITADYSNPDDFTKFLFLIQCDRSVTHEIVRHRPVSYLQASQRYIRYNNKNPYLVCIGSKQKEVLGKEVAAFSKLAFEKYTELLKTNRPEDARLVLPNCTETKIFVYADKVEYRHFFRMRQSKVAYPPIKEIFDQVYYTLINKKFI